jgi:DNA-binding LacI/PurR family transcriptional regulator
VGIISADPLSNKGSGSDATNAAFYEHFVRRAGELGISLRKEWVCRPRHRPAGEEHAGFGYEQFLALWRQRERPEALVIWPDSVALGALMAISEQGLNIPQDLKLILHKNDAVDLFCPFPATFVVTRVQAVAEALWEQILKQSEGERCRPILVPFQIRRTNTRPKKAKTASRKIPEKTGSMR